MIINIPKAELLKNVPLAKGWYSALVKKFEAKPSADGKSTNFIYTFDIEKDHREIDHYFNSKEPRFMEPFLKATLNSKYELSQVPDGESFSFDTEIPVGNKVDVELYIDNYMGRLSNKISGFLPYGKSREAPPF